MRFLSRFLRLRWRQWWGQVRWHVRWHLRGSFFLFLFWGLLLVHRIGAYFWDMHGHWWVRSHGSPIAAQLHVRVRRVVGHPAGQRRCVRRGGGGVGVRVRPAGLARGLVVPVVGPGRLVVVLDPVRGLPLAGKHLVVVRGVGGRRAGSVVPLAVVRVPGVVPAGLPRACVDPVGALAALVPDLLPGVRAAALRFSCRAPFFLPGGLRPVSGLGKH
mmetsp:Transcript_34388/g.56743  ORF Transcript_34388/g.56743 Transcript_34388/m.56743 type:complete len:215 (+) Transcript_34388:678-1322(+)